ncbi:2-polyprenylphenol 6-hydroxylase [Geminicoccaceae bacterium 1502E]|nr:2-polyprenylphenol 6-hydroxylase [Geminicoccaceae bacterium 1502E]
MLRTLRNLRRVAGTAFCLARHNALFPFELIPQARPLLALADIFVDKSAPGRPGERLARALQELGPAFIKLGQSLATRADLLGATIARDLSTLHDQLPPFSAAQARALLESELERPVGRLFSAFSDVPVAAASIAQVHLAVTADGREVAVKVLRPGIEELMERDLDFFLWLAQWAERLHPPLRRYRPIEAVRFLARSTRREMDLRLEASAAAEFAQNCEQDEGFKVPAVDWRLTGRRFVTFERVEGLPADEPDRLTAAGVDPDRVLEIAARVFFNQVFRDGFFHADMHPGNMVIAPDGTIVAMDFGIMGRLDLATRRHLAEMLLGFLQRDYGRVTDVFFRAGFLPPHQDRAAFTQACRAIGEPILGLPLDEISFGRLLGQLLAMAEEFEMETQPQLLLLQKTMVVAEGVGRGLNPRVNIWQLAQPLVESWMRTHLGPEAQAREALRDGADALRRLPALVRRAEGFLEKPSVVAVRAGPTGWLPLWLLPFVLGILLGLVLG